ncbi:hypothetical protein AMTRI_Chr06g196170 [Amborella trichopoda]
MYQTNPMTAAPQSQAHAGQHVPQISTFQSTLGNPQTDGPTVMPNTQQEGTLKAMQYMLVRMGMHEILPSKAYFQETLRGIEDLPFGFVIPEFRNKFNGKSDLDAHVDSDLFSMRTLQDRPNQLKGIFSQTLTGEAFNWHRRIMSARPHITPDEMFKLFVSHYRGSTPRPLALGELSATKQNLRESFKDFIGQFHEVAMRVIECPLTDLAKISIVLDNAAHKYKTFFGHDLILHSFDSIIEQVARHEVPEDTPQHQA